MMDAFLNMAALIYFCSKICILVCQNFHNIYAVTTNLKYKLLFRVILSTLVIFVVGYRSMRHAIVDISVCSDVV